jgi:hypothetical protein
MVVRNLDIFCARRRPAEADAVSVVHPDAVPARTVTSERLESVARWHAQVIKHTDDLKLSELSSGDRLDVDEALHPMSVSEALGIRVLERHDHSRIVTPRMNNVKRDYREAEIRRGEKALSLEVDSYGSWPRLQIRRVKKAI